jgi:hypothetical protein
VNFKHVNATENKSRPVCYVSMHIEKNFSFSIAAFDNEELRITLGSNWQESIGKKNIM